MTILHTTPTTQASPNLKTRDPPAPRSAAGIIISSKSLPAHPLLWNGPTAAGSTSSVVKSADSRIARNASSLGNGKHLEHQPRKAASYTCFLAPIRHAR